VTKGKAALFEPDKSAADIAPLGFAGHARAGYQREHVAVLPVPHHAEQRVL
jgi:hypothetical protein